MAIGTLLPQLSEYPFFSFQMTGKTGGGQVGTIQGKVGGSMILEGEQAPLESLDRVAISAIADGALPCKLAFMIVSMAGGTGIVWQRVREAFLVAIPAVHLLMFPQQSEFRQAVIETIQIIYPGKGFFAVAFGTGRSEFALVNILVALDTIRGQDAIAIPEQVAG